MSSEMRELMQSVLDFVNRQPCRCMSIAQLGERDYCDRCQSVKNLRALLARTEAGADGGAPICLFDATNPCDGTCGECHHLHASPKDAAPVADGADYPEAAEVCGEAYQVVGALLDALGIFDTPEGEKILDNLSQHRMVHRDVLPWTLPHPQDASGDAEDARRYRWARDHVGGTAWNDDNFATVTIGVTVPKPRGTCAFDVTAEMLDAAIDAAMQAKEAK